MYAQAFFKNMDCDAITVAPYMGEDSVKPFLEFPNKWVILLALTSNFGGKDFQNLELKQGGELFEEVLRKSQEWGSADQLMYVVGATRAESFTRIRKIIPDHFLLVPGVGAQGGSLQEVSKYGMNAQCGLLVNSSRGIIYASQGLDFAEVARHKAQELQIEMSQYLTEYL
jgi:orotidine-5'-phosphate decarboxylase